MVVNCLLPFACVLVSRSVRFRYGKTLPELGSLVSHIKMVPLYDEEAATPLLGEARQEYVQKTGITTAWAVSILTFVSNHTIF